MAAATGGTPTKTVARAAIQLKPSMRGFFNQVTRELAGAQMAAAGNAAGRTLSRGLSRGIGGRGGALGTLSALGSRSGLMFGSNFASNITKTTTGAISNLTNSIGNGVVGAVRSATSAVTTLGMTTAGVTATAAAALVAMTTYGGFSRALNIENAESKLGSLGYNVQHTSEIMKSALASVEGTIFSLDGAATAATNAVAAGIPKGEKLTNWLKLITDTATVANAPLDDVARVLNRVQANGRAFTLELNMLADRGLPIFSMLAEETGKSMVDLRKSIAAGEISVESLTNALHNKLGGAALASASTTSGAFANMRIAFSRFGATIATKSLPYLRLFFLEIRDIVDMLNKRFGPAMASATAAMGKKWEPVIVSMQERLEHFLDTTGKKPKKNFPMIDVLKDAFKGIKKEFAPVLSYFKKELPGALTWATGIVSAIVTKLFIGSKTDDSWLHSFIDGIRYINRELTPLYGMIGKYLPKILSRAEDMFGKLFRAAFIDSKTHDSWLGSLVTMITTYVPKALGIVIPLIDTLFNKMFVGGKGEESWLNQFIDLIGGIAKQIWPLVGIIANDVVPAFIDGFKQILPHLGEFVRALVTVGAAVITQFAPVLIDLIKAIAPLIVELMVLFVKLTPMITSFIGWLSSMAGGVAENEGFVQGLVRTVVGLFIAFKAMSFAVGLVTGIGVAFRGVIKTVKLFFKPLMVVFGWIKKIGTGFRLLQLGLLILRVRVLSGVFTFLTTRLALFVTALKASRVWILASAMASRIAAAAQWLWNLALTANPIGLVVAGIALLVAGLIYFFTQTEVGKKAWASLVEGFQHGLQEFTRWLGEAGANIATWWNDVTGSIADTWNNVISFISETLTNIGNWFNGIFTGIGNGFRAVGDFIMGIFQTVQDIFNGIVDGIAGGINRVVEWVRGLFDIFPQWLQDMLGMGDSTITMQGNVTTNAGFLPAMATGGDIMGATAVIAGEKEPETIVNRGLMNRHMEAVTRRLNSGELEGNGGRGDKYITIQVTAAPGMDIPELAREIRKQEEFASLR